VSVTDPDSGQKDSISVVKAPDGYLFKDSIFRWTPSSSYLGTDTLKTDSVVFAVIDNGAPALRDTLTAYLKVYAQAATIKFNVSYDDNGSTGGRVPVDTNAYTQGARVTVKGNTGTLVNAGHTFAGWNTAADGKGTSYAESNTFSIGSSDVVLYAQWTIALSSSKFLTSFGFTSPPVTGTVNEAAKTVAVTVPHGTNVTALVADFASNGTSVKVGSIVQVSGATANNFTSPVTYTVTAEDGSMQNYTVTVTVALNTAKAITAFSFSSPSATGTIDETAMAISLSVPYGTNVTALVATFSTNGAAVKVGSAVQVSGTTANNFSNPVTYMVTAADGSTQDYVVTVSVVLNTAKALTSFSFVSPSVTGTINEAAKTVAVTVPYGTNLTALVANFASTGASVKVGSTVQVSGASTNDFTNPVTYTAVAADNSTQDYIVTVTVALNPGKSITSFSFTSPAATGTINETAGTVSVSVPYGTNVTALVATFSTVGASVKVGSTVQVSGTTANNFTSPVTYTVTAADGSTQDYVVIVTVGLNNAKALTAFGFTNPAATGTINETAKTVNVSVPYGTSLSALVATFSTTGATVKVGSTVQVSGTMANNFTNPITYTVTAADATTQSYLVTVTVTPPYDYVVTFDAQGATNPAPIHIIQPATKVGTLPAVPAKTGYRFDGWYTAPSGGGTQFIATTPVTSSLTVYAKWTQVFTITYHGNNNSNGTVPVDTNHYTNGIYVTVLGNTGNLVRTGYTFHCWNTNSLGTETERCPGATFPMGSQNVDLYAEWPPNSYTITFDGQGATTPANPATINVTVPATTVGTLPTQPLKTAYVFDGWWTEKNGSGTQFTATTTVSQNDTVYGKWVIKDMDGNIYTEVTIGTQVWMVENLKTTKYNDGAGIPIISKDSISWTPGYCWYNDSITYKTPYGALYNGYVVGTGRLAPIGWHVPTKADWTTLLSFVGNDSTAGGPLKEAGLSHWNTPNASATNSTGFTALPGGQRRYYAPFGGIGGWGYWWSATQYDPVYETWGVYLEYDNAHLIVSTEKNNTGLSVRCIRDY
jgi:uncharacterized protein (TIGR02145 family)/uncharacterized repeat protein (TIGR02543 family)